MDLPGVALVLAQAEGAGGAADPGAPPPNLLDSLAFPLILGFVFVYFFLIRPQKREAAEKEALLSGLKKNDRVVTTGGMYGRIVNIKDDEVTLQVDDQAKVKIRFLKSAIARVVQTNKTADSKK